MTFTDREPCRTTTRAPQIRPGLRAFQFISLEGGFDMDSTTIIRIVAGVLFVIVLGILIQRRRTKVR